MAYRVALKRSHPIGHMRRAGREFSASPVILCDDEMVPAIRGEPYLDIEDLGRDVPAESQAPPEPEKPKRKRR